MGKMGKKNTSYEQFEAGTYEVSGIEFFSKDNSGNPTYVTQDWGGETILVARYRTKNEAGEDGPPGSITPDELSLFVHAFGGDASELPQDELQALTVAEDLINKATKKVNVRVGKSGWIFDVSGMSLPQGEYIFKFAGVKNRTKDGEPKWFTGAFGTFTVLLFKVDMPDNIFHGSLGEIWLNQEYLNLVRCLLPKGYSSFLGTAETELEWLENMALEEGARIYAEVYPDEGKQKPKIQRSTVKVVDEETSIEVENVPSYTHLYQAIADDLDGVFWKDSVGFKDGGLSDAGRAWAKQHLGPIFEELSLPREFDALNVHQVKSVLVKLGRNDLATLIKEDEAPW